MAVGLEHPQRLSDRHPADPQRRGEVLLAQGAAGRDVPAQDPGPKLVEHGRLRRSWADEVTHRQHLSRPGVARETVADRGAGQRDGIGHGWHAARIDDRFEPQAGGELERRGDVVDRSGGDPDFGQGRDPVRARCRPQLLSEQASQVRAVRDARWVRGEVWLVGQVQPEGAAQRCELAVVAHRQRKHPVGGGQGLVRGDAGVGVAHGLGDRAGAEHALRLVDQSRDRWSSAG